MHGMNDELFPTGPAPDRTERAGDPAHAPLAERMRPRDLDGIVGQEDLLGPGRPLRRLIEGGRPPSLLLWGPPGCGKTTLARVVAARLDARVLEYSAVQVGSRELKTVMAEAARLLRDHGRRTVIFLDEIHRFNKAQQDALLPWVERGDILLIGATTENPSFEINAALLSRLRLFVLQPLSTGALVDLLRRALESPQGLAGRAPAFTDDGLAALAGLADGDARAALSLLEMCVDAVGETDTPVDRERIAGLIRDRSLRYDKAGEEHYNLISALHKSIRNSDPDAALYYLARMLEGGADPLYVARRLVRVASEDVGLADPGALSLCIAARDAVRFVGRPEGDLALAQAVVHLALAPKSNALYRGYGEAVAEIRRGANPPVPLHLRNAPTRLMRELGYGEGYRYAHDLPEGVAPMTCLPEPLADRVFYRPTDRGREARYRERLEAIRRWRREALAREAGGDGAEPEKDSPTGKTTNHGGDG